VPAGFTLDGYPLDDLVVYFMQKIDKKSEINGTKLFDGFSRYHLLRRQFGYDFGKKNNIKSAGSAPHISVPFNLRQIL
jgi:hypothetical protein